MTVASADLRVGIRCALVSQRRPTVTILSSLLAAQDHLGYLPDQAIEEVAAHTDSSINDVWGVASFYPNFRFSPPTDHSVEVCWGPTCHLSGAPKIVDQIMGECGLDGEGDTGDGKLALKYTTCLGACSQAPVISVDHRLHGRVTVESALGLVRPLLGRSP